MNFSNYLNQSWNEHASKPKEVANSFSQGLSLITSSDEASQFARLVCHVYGEHLGLWDKGIEFLSKLKELNILDQTGIHSINLQIASLKLSGNYEVDLNQLSNSEKVRVLSLSASAVFEQGEAIRAMDYFLQANSLAENGLDKTDVANRTLAITGNNLASSLEEKLTRSSEETSLMILAAQTARKFWEIAGSWVEVERAEYRLAKSFLRANNFEQSVVHASESLRICEINKAPPLEFFFIYECFASIYKNFERQQELSVAIQKMQHYFELLEVEDKSWCQEELLKITRAN